jgi:histidinol-phosphate aminotransferase
MEVSSFHSLPPENVVICAGSIQGIDITVDALINEGDEIVVTELTFEEFLYSANRKKPVIKRSDMTFDLALNIDNLESHCNEKTKLVYIVNPNNPTGKYVSTDEIVKIADSIPNGYLIVDEANIEFATGVKSMLRYFDPKGNIIVLRTFSKAYGLAGMRVGYMVAPDEVVSRLLSDYPPYKCSELSLLAAIEALGDQFFLVESVNKIRSEYLRFVNRLDKLGLAYIPSDVHTVLVKRPQAFETLEEFVKYLNKNDIGVVRSDKCDAVRIVMMQPSETDFLLKVLTNIN